MSVPRTCRALDAQRVVDSMWRNPPAPLMTDGVAAQRPYGTHPPVAWDPRRPADGFTDLTGTTLSGLLGADRSGTTVVAAQVLGRAIGAHAGTHSGWEMKVVGVAL